MKLSKRDFFKLIGASGAASTAIATMSPHVTAPLIDKGELVRQEFGAAMFDVRHRILYSRFTPDDFKQSDRLRVFSKTVRDFADGFQSTNMLSPGSLHVPTEFAITGISIIVDRGHTEREIAAFERNVSGRLMVATKIFGDLYMPRMVVRAALDDLVQREGAPTKLISSKVLKLDPPLFVPSRTYFDVELQRSAFHVVEIGGSVLLDGYMATAIQ